MLSFQEFQEQVLSVFDVTEKECKFAKNCIYLGATISYDNYQVVFEVKYIKSNGRWHIQKFLAQGCETFSDSLTQGIKTIDKQTTDSINNELQVFHKIQEGRKKAVFQEFFKLLEELKKQKINRGKLCYRFKSFNLQSKKIFPIIFGNLSKSNLLTIMANIGQK
jgi:uncharacterized membrane protein